MAGSRRNLLFRVSIVINVFVLVYATLYLSGGPGPVGYWQPIPATGPDWNENRVLQREELRSNESVIPQERLYPTIRNYDESTSQRTPSTAPPTTNNTASSTAAITILANMTADVHNENVLTDSTLDKLRDLLHCNNRDFMLQKVQRGEYWVLSNYIRAEHGPLDCHETITYTTHAGFDFLDNVKPLVERWTAPVSLAIYAPGSDLTSAVDSIKYLRECMGTDLIKRYVTFHIFFSYKHFPPRIPVSDSVLAATYECPPIPPYEVESNSTYMKKHSLLYPVNVARNIARDAALTHFVLPSDIELYPSPNLVPKFLNMIARNGKPLNTSTNPRVFPITIFEIAANVQVPSTKKELQAMLKKKKAIPFHKYVCPDCHNIPQAQQWMKAKETNQMEVFHVGKRQGKHVFWEPIFIGTHEDPHYDDRLSWEGKKDKMTQGYILCVKDYDFMILNNAFLTHKPGIKKYVRDKKRDTLASKQTAFIKGHIGPELKKLYGAKNGCLL